MESAMPFGQSDCAHNQKLLNWIKQALLNRGDPAWLNESDFARGPLVDAALAAAEDLARVLSRGCALRAVLGWAISQLRPEQPASSTARMEAPEDWLGPDPAWWPYLFLRHELMIDPTIEYSGIFGAPLPITMPETSGAAGYMDVSAVRQWAAEALFQKVQMFLDGSAAKDQVAVFALAEHCAGIGPLTDCSRLLGIAAVFRTCCPRRWLGEMAREEGVADPDPLLDGLIEQHVVEANPELQTIRLPDGHRRWLWFTPDRELTARRHSGAACRLLSVDPTEAAWHLYQAGQHVPFLVIAGSVISGASRQQCQDLGQLLAHVPQAGLSDTQCSLWNIVRGAVAWKEAVFDDGPGSGSSPSNLASSAQMECLLLTAFVLAMTEAAVIMEIGAIANRELAIPGSFWPDVLFNGPPAATYRAHGFAMEEDPRHAANRVSAIPQSSLGIGNIVLAGAALAGRHYDQALRWAMEALAQPEFVSCAWRTARCLEFISGIYLAMNAPDRAGHCARLARAIHQKMGDNTGAASCQLIAAEAFLQLGLAAQAAAVLPQEKDSATIRRFVRLDWTWRALSFRTSAFLGNWPEAAAEWRAATALYEQSGFAGEIRELRRLFPPEIDPDQYAG